MIECQKVDVEPQTVAVVAGEVAMDKLTEFFGEAFPAVVSAIESQGLTVVGPPFAFYPTPPTEVVMLEAGFPTASPVEPDGMVVAGDLPGGPAVSAVHVGPYDTMEQTYTELQAWMGDRGLRPAPHMWEIYLSDPDTEPDPSLWRTQIIWPIAD